MHNRADFIILILFLLTIIMLFVFPIVGLVMLFIFACWMIIKGFKNLRHNDHCAMCHKKLTIMNTGVYGRLKDGGQLCASCFRHLSLEIAFDSEFYTLEELIAADQKAKAEEEALQKEKSGTKNGEKRAIRNEYMYTIVDPILGNEEFIEVALYGIYNKSKGYLVLTNERLLFVYRTPIQKVESSNFFTTIRYANANSCEVLPLSSITDITISKMLFSKKINIYLLNIIFVFKSKENFSKIQTMVDKINARRGINPNSETTSSNANGPTITGTITWTSDDDVFDKIGKLKKLLDSGAITEEEFQEKKKKLMGQI